MKTDTRASFVNFVYPFLFDACSFSARVAAVRDASWSMPKPKKSSETSVRVWETSSFPLEELLPHVADYLNPKSSDPTALVWRLAGRPFTSLHGFGRDASWHLSFVSGNPRQRRDLDFRFHCVELALFRVGVGFITVTACPKTDSAADWLDFVHYFRFAGGQRDVWLGAKRDPGDGPASEFFPEVAGGLEVDMPKRNLMALLRGLLRTGRVVEDATTDWWEDVYVRDQLISFACLFFDGVGENKASMRETVYRVRNVFHSARQIHPCEDDTSLDHASLMQYAERQWFVFTLEGGAFVAFDAPDTEFFRNTLPGHVGRHYYFLFQLSLFQRFALMRLSRQVAEAWLRGDEEIRAAEFASIRDNLLEFTARGCFTQVMQRDRPHQCYRRWQEAFQLDALYREVRDEVREIHDYLEMKNAEKLTRAANSLNYVAFIFATLSIIVGILGVNIRGCTSGPNEGIELADLYWIVAGGGVIGLLAVWLVSRLFRHGSRNTAIGKGRKPASLPAPPETLDTRAADPELIAQESERTPTESEPATQSARGEG